MCLVTHGEDMLGVLVYVMVHIDYYSVVLPKGQRV